MPQPSNQNEDFKRTLLIADARVDLGALTVHRDGTSIRLTRKAAGVLIELARQPGVTLGREELLDRVWRNAFTTPDVVGHAITVLRRAFGDSPDASRIIETIPKVGYRLIVDARFEERSAVAADTAAPQAHDSAAATVEPDAAAPTSRATPGPGMASSGPGWNQTAVIAALAILIACTSFLGARAIYKMPLPLAETDTAFRLLTYSPGAEVTPGLSGDGTRLSYSQSPEEGAGLQIFVQSVSSAERRQLTDEPSNDHSQARWSREDSELLFLSRNERCEIRILAVETGRQRLVAPCPASGPVFFDWDPLDDQRIVVTMSDPSGEDPGGIGELRQDGNWSLQPMAYTRNAGDIDIEPRFSPDGAWIAFRRGPNPTSDLFVMPSEGGEPRRLTRLRSRLSGFAWLPDASGLLIASDHSGRNEVHRVELESGRLQPIGLANASQLDVSRRSGRLAFQADRWQSALTLVQLSEDGNESEVAPVPDSSGNDLSPAIAAGRDRAVFVSDRDGSQELWLRSRDGQESTRLTTHRDRILDRPGWAPGDEHIAYIARANGIQEIWEHSVSAAGGTMLAAGEAALRDVLYAANGRDLWLVAWNEDSWQLMRCERPQRGPCQLSSTGIAALRIDRGEAGTLWLQQPDRRSELLVLDEASLRETGRVELPANEGWSVQDDRIVFIRQLNEQRTLIGSYDWRNERLAASALITGNRPVPYSRPQHFQGDRTILLPTLIEDASDIGLLELRDN